MACKDMSGKIVPCNLPDGRKNPAVVSSGMLAGDIKSIDIKTMQDGGSIALPKSAADYAKKNVGKPMSQRQTNTLNSVQYYQDMLNKKKNTGTFAGDPNPESPGYAKDIAKVALKKKLLGKVFSFAGKRIAQVPSFVLGAFDAQGANTKDRYGNPLTPIANKYN